MEATSAQQLAWATIGRAPNLHADHLRAALQEVGEPAELLRLGASRLQRLGLPPAASRFLGAGVDPAVEADLNWLQRETITLLPYTASGYPPLLSQIKTAPAVLYVRGDPAHLLRPQIAMVGSRNPSTGGLRTAVDFARYFAQVGLAVTSGLALGIDAASHDGALDGGGYTIAVCGTGLDRVYPPRHRALADRIAARGALVSEFPPGTAPVPHNFPRRNRVISGLSRGTLVVEAARESGSLVTARRAADQGREVFAIPGSIHSPLSRGCHDLILQGARLTTCCEDVLGELATSLGNFSVSKQGVINLTDGPGAVLQLDKAYEMLLDALGFEPASIDDLVDRTGLEGRSVASMLLILELEGRIEPLPGARYCRVT